MRYPMQVFEYEDRDQFRVLEIDGQPWFVLADVCRVLAITNPSMAAKGLDEDERRKVDLSTLNTTEGVKINSLGVGSGNSESWLINESGLYSLILTSRKPAARKFKKWVTAEVLPSIRRTGRYGLTKGIPAFIRRYNENWNRVSTGHFSVLSELVIRLWGALEHQGHIMADRASNGTENRPDCSVGRLFSNWLKERHPTVSDNFSMYLHWTPDGEFEVRQYPHSMWPLFIEFLDTVWIPKHYARYFKTRDPAALPYLASLLPAASPKPRLPAKRPANQGKKESA